MASLITRRERKKQQARIRAGPSTKVYRPIFDTEYKKYRTNPQLRHETERYFEGELAQKELGKEKSFNLSPISVEPNYFIPIKEEVDTRTLLGLSNRRLGKLTPQPVGPVTSPIFDTIGKRSQLERKRSPPTSPKNYPGIKGTGVKAERAAKKEFNKTLKKRSADGGKKRRKTRRKKRKRKTRRKKKKSRRRKKRKSHKRRRK